MSSKLVYNWRTILVQAWSSRTFLAIILLDLLTVVLTLSDSGASQVWHTVVLLANVALGGLGLYLRVRYQPGVSK